MAFQGAIIRANDEQEKLSLVKNCVNDKNMSLRMIIRMIISKLQMNITGCLVAACW